MKIQGAETKLLALFTPFSHKNLQYKRHTRDGTQSVETKTRPECYDDDGHPPTNDSWWTSRAYFFFLVFFFVFFFPAWQKMNESNNALSSSSSSSFPTSLLNNDSWRVSFWEGWKGPPPPPPSPPPRRTLLNKDDGKVVGAFPQPHHRTIISYKRNRNSRSYSKRPRNITKPY